MSLVRPLLIEISNFSVLDEPSNTSMIRYYETLAKNHMDQYLNLLMRKVQNPTVIDANVVGHRKSSRQKFRENEFTKMEVAQEYAIQFFQTLMDSFHNFKHYCQTVPLTTEESAECDIIINSETEDAVLASAFKEYDYKLQNIKVQGRYQNPAGFSGKIAVS